VIRLGDGSDLRDCFARTREIRRGLVEAGQALSAADFGRGGKAPSEWTRSAFLPEACA
jgi:cyclohexadieny/prephenate dehydrogenase